MKEIHKWAQDQVLSLAHVKTKFQDTRNSQDVTYEDFAVVPLREWHEISPGVEIFFLEYNPKYYILKCRMGVNGESVLSDHRHSTHKELFLLIEGYMKDNMDPSIHLTEMDTHVYDKGVAHEPVGRNELVIIGRR